MTLKELADAGGVTERTVRYLIAQDLVPASPRRGRGADAYGETHLDGVRECKRLIDAGLSVPAIRAMRRIAHRAGPAAASAPGPGDGAVLHRDGRFELRLIHPDALRGFRKEELPALLAALGRAVGDALAASDASHDPSPCPDPSEETPSCR